MTAPRRSRRAARAAAAARRSAPTPGGRRIRTKRLRFDREGKPIVDVRPPDHWARRPIVKVVVFSGGALAAVGSLLVGGDGGDVIVALATASFAGLIMAAAVGQMRGRVAPLPGRDRRLVSPIAVFLVGLSWYPAAVGVLVDVWAVPDDGSAWSRASAWCTVGLWCAAGVVQILSLSDQWPDRWRPPRARLHPPRDAAIADPESDDGPPVAGPPPARR